MCIKIFILILFNFFFFNSVSFCEGLDDLGNSNEANKSLMFFLIFLVYIISTAIVKKQIDDRSNATRDLEKNLNLNKDNIESMKDVKDELKNISQNYSEFNNEMSKYVLAFLVYGAFIISFIYIYNLWDIPQKVKNFYKKHKNIFTFSVYLFVICIIVII
jgi:hypothetical protein